MLSGGPLGWNVQNPLFLSSREKANYLSGKSQGQGQDAAIVTGPGSQQARSQVHDGCFLMSQAIMGESVATQSPLPVNCQPISDTCWFQCLTSHPRFHLRCWLDFSLVQTHLLVKPSLNSVSSHQCLEAENFIPSPGFSLTLMTAFLLLVSKGKAPAVTDLGQHHVGHGHRPMTALGHRSRVLTCFLVSAGL